MKKLFFLLLSFISIQSSILAQVPSNEKFTTLLKKNVDSKGLVDYKAIKANKEKLQDYLDLISKEKPADDWSKDEKMAFWINAYNAYTIKLIVDNYPVKSIKDLNPKVSIVYVSTIWDKKFFSIGGEKMSLNMIENRILRKMDDPRIHFAINCASMSCPEMLNEAYEAKKLDKQLTQQAKKFLADKSRNDIDAKSPKISNIFNWFGKDFKRKGQTVIDFINKFSSVKINEDAEVSYMDYSWKLNEQK